ncbi:zinc finger BED domain-containing protein 4 [Aplysia californica]|uniref:Zinc finger BED domain-containing protein 4 n=1 Tax=Aplysia californica TaxID=6500 RepID=A0ABM0K831_APLCA|nr:zinc finger BED domain-containing protein 4 [Aplysia californica]
MSSTPKRFYKQQNAPRFRSGVWHFMRKDDHKNATCLICNSKFKFHGSTTSLRSHLRAKHPEHDFSGEYDQEEAQAASRLVNLLQPVKAPEPSPSPSEVKPESNRVKSGVWKLMTKDSPYIATCIVCNAKFKFHGSTSSLWAHLKAKHPVELDNSATEDPNESQLLQFSAAQNHPTESSVSGSASVTVSVKKSETSEKISFHREPTTKKKQLERVLVEMIVRDLQPLSIVEEGGFQKLIHTLDPKYTLPSPKQLATTILPNLQKEEIRKLKAELGDIANVTVTTEIWTSVVTDSFLTVSVHYLNSQWQRKYAVLETCKLVDDLTPANIAEELSRVFTAWDLHPKVTCVVTDNSENMAAAMRMLRLPHVTCYAHTMDGIVRDSLRNVQEVTRLAKKVRDIVSFFHHSEMDSEKLMHLQREQERQPQKLKRDVPSQWVSTFYMLERFIHLYGFIAGALYQVGRAELLLSDDELEVVKHCVKVLEPFEVAVKEMTSEKHMPMCKVIPMTKAISQFVSRNTQNSGGDISGLATELELQMSRHFDNMEDNFLYGASTLLDPRFKKLPFSTSEAVGNTEQQLGEEILIQTEPAAVLKPETEAMDDSKSLWSSFDQQVEFTLSALSNPQESTVEFNRYYEEMLLQRQENPFRWWEKMSKFLTRLSPIAMKYLAIPAASIPAERLFLKNQEVISLRRSILKHSVVDTVLFLNNRFSV